MFEVVKSEEGIFEQRTIYFLKSWKTVTKVELDEILYMEAY